MAAAKPIQRMTKKNNLIVFITVYLLGVALAALLTGCKGCSKPKYIPPTAVEVIEQKHNPEIESLRNMFLVLSDSIYKLNEQLQKQSKEQQFANRKASATIGKLQQALAAKDTGKIIIYSEDAAEEFTVFKEEVAKKDSLQDRLVMMQHEAITHLNGEIELHEAKFAELKTAYNIQDLKLSDYARQNERLQKKLKRAKFWNKVLGVGTAAGAVLAGIVFL